jgi:hypothetical protein
VKKVFLPFTPRIILDIEYTIMSGCSKSSFASACDVIFLGILSFLYSDLIFTLIKLKLTLGFVRMFFFLQIHPVHVVRSILQQPN